MLSHAWKKLAKEYDLTIGNGVAYGEFRGYNATFSDGSNTKRVDFSVYVPDNTAYDRLEEELNTRDLEKEFRIEDFQLDESRIVIIFKDAPGTVKRIMNFLDWFLPKLSECGIGGDGVCAYCGRPLEKMHPGSRSTALPIVCIAAVQTVFQTVWNRFMKRKRQRVQGLA